MNEDGKLKIARVLISGKVQGVCFRGSTEKEAIKDELRGWVRNIEDNNTQVKAVFGGSTDLVKKIVAWCLEGPETADVKKLVVSFEDAEGPEIEELPFPFDPGY